MLKNSQKVIVRLCRRIVNKLSKKLRKIQNPMLKNRRNYDSQLLFVTFVKKLSKKLTRIENFTLKSSRSVIVRFM